jgi:hypothetical protein
MVQHQLTVAVKLAPFAIVTGDSFHLLTPFLWGYRWFSPFPPTKRTVFRRLPANRLLFENFSKYFLSGEADRRKRQKTPGWWQTSRAKKEAKRYEIT